VTPLESLVREVQALPAASSAAPTPPAEDEAARQLQICNACRYCEGYCAVFQAMTRRLEFGAADVHYLANLCHNCGACLHACQYAPPHEFAVNVPMAMARVRTRTYARYAWPPGFGALYRRNGLTVAVALGAGLALFLALALWRNGTLWQAPPGGDFYAIFPHNLLVALFAPVFIFSCTALGVGVARFWRTVAPGAASGDAVREATGNVLRLTYLDGGHGDGCNEADDRFTPWRRRFHHATFYGFLLCFAATCVATLYHYGRGWPAPYPYASVPVVLGTVGGVLLLAGTAGLFALNVRRDPRHGATQERTMDRALLALLFLASATGLALLAWRDTGAMGVLLAVHLGFVMALFLTLPYGKLAHGAYRAAALLKWSIERRQPNRLQMGLE
jgi:citrate/tricarballylate utilization protein